jgi:hypothetical protein
MKAVATCVGVAEGHRSVRPAWLGRVKRPMNLSIRPWKFTLGKTTEAKQPFQTRHSGHMKGVESMYTSGKMAIKVGSAGEGRTGLGRRPKVLARSTVTY